MEADMSHYEEDLRAIANPENINEAVFAYSPYVLRKAFERAPIVQRLIAAGREISPLISDELERNTELPEISRACLVYILEQIDNRQMVRVVSPLFRTELKNPGPFFIHFAAHGLRAAHHLKVRERDISYSNAELRELLDKLE
jgi:hypothetical protein